jgi:putative ATP-binding cassette transporter
MGERRRHTLFDRRFIQHLRRLIGIYWTSPDARRGAMLLGGAVALELATVYGTFRLSDAERRIMDALQAKEGSRFVAALGLFAVISAGFLLASAYRIYLRQLVEIRWRRGETADYLARWMSERACCQMYRHRDEVDNPDQRVAEDVRDFVGSALGLSLSLLAAVATLVSFGSLLWTLSSDCPLPLQTYHLHVPGFLLWVALLYAALSTWLTHIVGRPLVRLNVERLRYEADFRYGLMRFRDNVEVIGLSKGEELARRGALTRFQNVIQNWWQLIVAQRRLTVFTGIVGQANGIVPLLVAAPGFFTGLITLGVVVQIRFAYGQVSGALNWFVFAYQEIARWRANVERLSTFTEALDAMARDVEQSKIHVVPGEPPELRLTNLKLDAPGGGTLLDPVNATVTAGQRVAITGPSGAGKTTLLRAIAGVWPFGSGRIEVPARARMMFVPQWPYLPEGSLREVMSYPAAEGSVADESIVEVLETLGLGDLATHLDATEPWDQRLTPNEQQRVGIARVLLNAPDWVFIDKATSALDEDMERHVYTLLADRLPRTTVMSVAQRPELAAYHTQRWTMTRSDHGASTLRAA